MVPTAIATHLKLNARPTRVEQCPEEETEAIIFWLRRRHEKDIGEVKDTEDLANLMFEASVDTGFELEGLIGHDSEA